MQTISVIGCGRVGKTLCRLWTARGVLQVRTVLNRSLASGQRAVEFVGAGRAVSEIAQVEPAALMMIATPDEAIQACCEALAEAGRIQPHAVVFHLSGALPSAVLQPAAERGAAVASVHPVKSFADPRLAAETFEGTHCALEGDERACQVLSEVFRSLGAVLFSIQPAQKTTYHAGMVFVCNYLVALMEAGLRCFDAAAVDRKTAMRLIQPIVRGTVDNLFRLGPAAALTGPIARGERCVVEMHLKALSRESSLLCRMYSVLGLMAAELARAQSTPEESLARIRQLLEQPPCQDPEPPAEEDHSTRRR